MVLDKWLTKYKHNNILINKQCFERVMGCILFKKNLLWAHFSGTGRESSLPDVSSVVASGRWVVRSIGTQNATPSATHRLRNFSILPKQKLNYLL